MITENIKLCDFVERFVGHNSTVYLYKEHYEIENKSRVRHDELLWFGKDWQISFAYDDSDYFKTHPEVLPCPYRDAIVEKVVTPQSIIPAIGDVGIVIKEADKL